MKKEIIALKEWIRIYNTGNYMSKKLPRCSELQDFINRCFGLSTDTFNGNGIRTMDLGRIQLLRLALEIAKLKKPTLKEEE